MGNINNPITQKPLKIESCIEHDLKTELLVARLTGQLNENEVSLVMKALKAADSKPIPTGYDNVVNADEFNRYGREALKGRPRALRFATELFGKKDCPIDISPRSISEDEYTALAAAYIGTTIFIGLQGVPIYETQEGGSK